MEFLHNDLKEFRNAINLVSEKNGIVAEIIEKDYYVTMVLRLLSQRLPFIVFKGGTSLSKCYHVIERFSEDIDIAVDRKITQGQRGHVKDAIKDVAAELGMDIPNIEDTRSKRDFNRYILSYKSVIENGNNIINPAVIIETTYSIPSFPAPKMTVTNYIGEMMKVEAPDYISGYLLDEFKMQIQSLERTYADKIFAICDYYLDGKIQGHSRHLYDLFKLKKIIKIDKEFKKLFEKVRQARKITSICPSAQDDEDVSVLLKEICESDAYRFDYENITEKLLNENVSYDNCILCVREIASLID